MKVIQAIVTLGFPEEFGPLDGRHPLNRFETNEKVVEELLRDALHAGLRPGVQIIVRVREEGK